MKSWDFFDRVLSVFHITLRKRSKASEILQFLFFLSLIIKGIDGVVEVISGATLLFLGKTDVLNLLFDISQYDFLDISEDKAMRFVDHVSSVFTDYMKLFITIVLLGSGLVKVVLAVNLILKKMWAFPVALALLAAIIVYEGVQAILSWSLFVGCMTLLDIVVLFIIWRQYYYLNRHH